MAALNETSDQPESASQRGPVFVDASGRRLRRVKLIGLGALGLAAGYVILLLVALVGGPNIAAPYLPLPSVPAAPAAPVARDLPSSPAAPVSNAAGPPANEDQRLAPVAPVAFQAPGTPPSPIPVAQPINGAAALHAAPFAPAATPAPPTSPGKSGNAPGQATRPSTPAHP
ncbi:hypothetical protein [Arthrobacter sp. MMS18-M83]|uniref:hypothetical protein n=1 Tax=Arthrobacter sp. MMS18-M83 TaxID=2996261 RepID=UPI00227B7845|nr:hypothetical protein [Arthrobacter sp. MMS18-M83]WAH97177.1 hypothetical protein OW521_23005 [Arthrobacter sp. MMS18-M83]